MIDDLNAEASGYSIGNRKSSIGNTSPEPLGLPLYELKNFKQRK
jgi:hypothetical protein